MNTPPSPSTVGSCEVRNGPVLSRAAAAIARRLLEQTGEHPVVSLVFDLDPERFATGPARASQLRSLIDDALRAGRGDGSLGHDDRKAVEEDLGRLETYMESGEAPVSGARGLAVFSSVRQELFEAVPLSHPVAPRLPGQTLSAA